MLLSKIIRTDSGLPPSDEGWTTDWPTAPGAYWFAGWPHGQPGNGPADEVTKRVSLLIVHLDGDNKPMYVCDGAFVYRKYGAGKFKRAEIPIPATWEQP